MSEDLQLEEEIESPFSRFCKVQNELKVPKTHFNSFGKYNYRNCEDIMDAVKPLLKKYNLLMVISDSVVNIGQRFYVNAVSKVYDSITGEFILENSAFAREDEIKKGMDGAQVTGASSSYARKYCLNGLFNIDDSKDEDTTNKGDNKPQITPQSEKWGEMVKGLKNGIGWNMVCKKYTVSDEHKKQAEKEAGL